MTAPAKIQKLRAIFAAAPEPVLEQLRVAMAFGERSAADSFPYGEVSDLIEEVAAQRGLSISEQAQERETDSGAGEGEEDVDLVFKPESFEDDAPLVLEEEARVDPEPYVPPVFSPPRNAMHAFFGAFEPLIIDPPRFLPRIDGYICSTSLPAIWRLLNEEASGGVIRDAWLKAEMLDEPEEEEFYREISDQMHLAARSVLDDLTARSREDPAIRRALISRLGSNAIFGDLVEFKTLLPLARRLQEAFTRMLPLLHMLSEKNVTAIVDIIAAEARGNAALAGYLQLSAVSCLAQPWQALRLLVPLQAADLPGGAESCLIADHLIAFVSAQPEWLERLILKGSFTPETLDAVTAFAETLSGISAEIDSLDDKHDFLERLSPTRTAGADLFGGLVKRALATIHDVLPLRDGADGRLEPDAGWLAVSQQRADIIEAANAAAIFLVGADATAAVFDQQALLDRARERAAQEVTAFAEQLAEAIRRAGSENRQQVSRLTGHVSDLVRHLSGADVAERVREQFDVALRAA
ncbi:hypothetical protein [Parvularcula sp. IMCC14364]|uniref:hypothetical protein n=1 Tax=Parvularcula sp. IMCC14364 TaxID=3067902 RepID=UPI00274256B7|nr:hypothetical protein [Parvularcula sp. IMCC14364]